MMVMMTILSVILTLEKLTVETIAVIVAIVVDICCYCCCDGSDDDDDNDDDDVVAVGDIVISSLIRLRAVCKMD